MKTSSVGSFQYLLDQSVPLLDRVLGPLQSLIMNTIWNEPGTVMFNNRALVKKLRDSNWKGAYTTVSTTTARLEAHGLLKRVDYKGMSILYQPTVSREEFLARIRDAFR